MASFFPTKVRSVVTYPVCVDLDDLFGSERYKPSLERVIVYLHRIYSEHSGGSFEHLGRRGVVTEQFVLLMPTVAAYVAEIELANAVRDHALGKMSSENIKVYLKKYLETHTFVYREVEGEWRQEFKSGYSKRTGYDVPLFYIDGFGVANPVQKHLLPAIVARSGNHAQFSITSL